MAINVRFMTELNQMKEAVRLQTIYWGDDQESIVPSHMLFTIVQSGGQVIGAFDNNAMIGVLIGLVGLQDDQSVFISSKRMVVLPAYRSRGVGAMLKYAQRDHAAERGIKLVRWTFDPLLSLNAYFNIHKLGCISSTYLTNYYGTDPDSTLVTLGASDRLQADWWIEDSEQTNLTLIDYLEQGAAHGNHVDLNGRPYATNQVSSNSRSFLLQIPSNYAEIIASEPDLAKQWRTHTRQLFTNLFGRGYRVRDVVRDGDSQDMRVYYVFRR